MAYIMPLLEISSAHFHVLVEALRCTFLAFSVVQFSYDFLEIECEPGYYAVKQVKVGIQEKIWSRPVWGIVQFGCEMQTVKRPALILLMQPSEYKPKSGECIISWC